MEKNVERYLEKRAEDVREEWENSVGGIIEHFCKSPIEKLFLIEWKYQTQEEPKYHPKIFPNFYIMPQYKIIIGDNQYRVDFLIYYTIDDQWIYKKKTKPKFHKNQSLIVELDSYLWHGSDPEQFTKEKEREGELQKEGWKTMRFSGREIIRDTEKCVHQVMNYFINIKKRFIKKEYKKD